MEIKTATEAKLGKGPKVVGRIDLDNLRARGPVAAPEKKETPAPARPAEVKAEAPVAEPAPKQEEKPQAETETPVSQKEVRLQEKSKAIGTETVRCVPSEPYGAGCSPAQGEGTYRFGGFEPVYPS